MILTLTSIVLSGVTVVLPAQARVCGLEMNLGQIADVRGDDAASIDKLRALSIGYAPAPGYTRLFQRWQIAQQIAAAAPGVKVDISGSETCRVMPETERLSGDSIRAAAERELRALFVGSDATIELQGRTSDLEIPKGANRSEIRAGLDKRELRSGSWSVPVGVWVDGSLYQTVRADFSVDLFTQMPVLVRDLKRGELLASDVIETRRVRVPVDLQAEPLPGNALSGAVALRDLPRGSAVTDRDVRRSELVRIGDSIQLEIRKGAITARSTVIAKQDGRMGDKIRVTNSDKSREITAVVVGRELVAIDLTPQRGSAN